MRGATVRHVSESAEILPPVVNVAPSRRGDGERIALAELWERYTSESNPVARERLILSYAPLVRYVAGRLLQTLPDHVDLDDLVSYGMCGLIDAIERFNPERGVSFETFAMMRIRGGIIDELRALDWVPRTVRQRAKMIERAMVDLEQQLQRSPTDAEVAGYLETPVEQYRENIGQVHRSVVMALNELWAGSDDEGGGVALLDVVTGSPDGNDPAALRAERAGQEQLTAAIARLPERERGVISLYYFEGLTLKDIGAIYSVTESRVSQVHSRALARLRAFMAEND